MPSTRKAPVAVFIMALVIALAAFRVLPIAISSLLGVLALTSPGACGSRVSAVRDRRRGSCSIVVASIALCRALTLTGGADLLGGAFMSVAGNLSPQIVLAAVMVFLGLLTNFVSNNAAAAIGTPVALSIAEQLGAPPSRSSSLRSSAATCPSPPRWATRPTY